MYLGNSCADPTPNIPGRLPHAQALARDGPVIRITIVESIVIRCLNFHASYRCRHAGACCRAGWPVPFDADESRRVRALHISSGTLAETQTGACVAGRAASGACSFYEEGARLCTIQRIGGHESLPVSCRMFPRSVLIDARGTFVSLSHFCPTAAALLFEPGPSAAVIDAPPSLVDVGPLDGLDARNAWPPLLRPGVLMDLESYDTWERLGIELLTREAVSPSAALGALHRVSARIAAWTPEEGPLSSRVREVFASCPVPAREVRRDDIGVKRWLAARLFACWVAYQKDGIAAIVDYLQACFGMFDQERARDGNALEAIRRTDLRVMHTEP